MTATRTKGFNTVVATLLIVLAVACSWPARANALLDGARREAGYQFGVFVTAWASAAKAYGETPGTAAVRERRAVGQFFFTIGMGETTRISMWLFTGM